MTLFRRIFRNFLSTGNIQQVKSKTAICSLSTSEFTPERDPAPLFFNNEIQNLLKSLTRVNFNKVFRKRNLNEKKLELPVYKFMTDEQLKEAREEAEKRADEILQMPPVVLPRKAIDHVLNKEPTLQGLDTARLVITDITFGIKNSDRLIIVREPDGTLHEAEWALRDRMNQVYFPTVGRELHTPRMFEEINLMSLFNRKEYEYVLDRACLQYEPDDSEYQKITTCTYQHINDNNEFDLLRSTRHFGPLAFHLAWFKNIDNLLLDLIETANMEEANSLVELYEKVQEIAIGGVDKFINEYSNKRAPLELAMQAYKDLEKQRQDYDQGIKVAHGRI